MDLYISIDFALHVPTLYVQCYKSIKHCELFVLYNKQAFALWFV